jgi:hypothetical protein
VTLANLVGYRVNGFRWSFYGIPTSLSPSARHDAVFGVVPDLRDVDFQNGVQAEGVREGPFVG